MYVNFSWNFLTLKINLIGGEKCFEMFFFYFFTLSGISYVKYSDNIVSLILYIPKVLKNMELTLSW